VDVLMASLGDPAAPPVDHTLPVRPVVRRSCGC
jgi:hypothetical protein